MTAILPTNSLLRDKIQSDEYNNVLNDINAKYAEMDKFINNLESDIQSIMDFEKDMISDKERGYDVGTSLDTLGFQKDSLQIGLIAQEVLSIEQANGYGSNNDTSLLVDLTEDETSYGLSYEKIVPILVSAIKELKTANDALTARVTALE